MKSDYRYTETNGGKKQFHKQIGTFSPDGLALDKDAKMNALRHSESSRFIS